MMNKRIIACIALILVCFVLYSAAAESETGSYPSLRFLRASPNDDARTLLEIPKGSKLIVTPVAGTDYASTTYNGISGYVKHLKWQAGEWDETAKPQIPTPLYYLVMNKATHTLTIYAANESGGRTDEIVRVITTAIGKRTTPTPSGTFKLTTREEWHFFGKSYAPFAIEYTNGKYLHGPLYRRKDVTSFIASHEEDIGDDATGGCLRMRYIDIKWIYENCTEGTVLEIR
ncbi:MAG: L,D-transpeptidase family protein [Oscillospiraceae bacterium]|jgi:lipoprotein-anchoring transpeptidase ErfK/SrfK|nr:L,D-transpeptidase family protein [Oscillospiraceae bacterium]